MFMFKITKWLFGFVLLSYCFHLGVLRSRYFHLIKVFVLFDIFSSKVNVDSFSCVILLCCSKILTRKRMVFQIPL